MRKKDNKGNNNTKTSKGGYLFIGIIVLLVAGALAIEQLRRYNEKIALENGVESICTIIELSSNKTLFAKYSYEVDGKTFYSHRAAPFSTIYPGEMFKIKYLKTKPQINIVLFEYPVVLEEGYSKIRGYVKKIHNNKAAFHYKFKDMTFERWQLLRKDHSLKKGDSIDIIVAETNPDIGIIYY